MPLPIPDYLFAAIECAAAPIHPHERPRFFEAMAAELQKHPTLGEGIIYRCAADLQRTFLVEARSEVSTTATARHLGGRRPAASRRPKNSSTTQYVASASAMAVEAIHEAPVTRD